MTTDAPSTLPAASRRDIDPRAYVKDHLPEFKSEHEAKTNYLTLRVFEFGDAEACVLLGTNPGTVFLWRKNDSLFAYWLDTAIWDFRKKLQVDLTLAQFYRNMWMALGIDAQVLGKAYTEGIDKLSKEQMEYLNRIRPRYSAEALINMLKAATGDLRDPTTLVVNTVIVQGPRGG